MAEVLRRRLFQIFLASVVLLLAVWWDTVVHLWTLVWTVDAFSHGIWVPPVSAWLICRNRHPLAAVPMAPWWPAVAGMAVVCGLWLIGEAAEARLFQHLALVGAINLMALGVMGPKAFKIIRFPMLFLFLMVPIGEQLVAPLQVLTAKAVIGVLDLTGVDFKADGVLIELSGGLYQVARACAGVKFFFTSMVLGVLLCHLVLQSWKRRLLFLIVAGLTPILANIIRVYSTILIAEWSGQEFAKGIDHILYGWGFLSIILIILIAAAYRFADKPAAEVDEDGVQLAKLDKADSVLTICFALLFPAGPVLASLWVSVFMPTVQIHSSQCAAFEFSAAACENCDFRTLGNPAIWRESSADKSVIWRYRQHAHIVEGTTGVYAPDRAGHRAQSVPISFVGHGWAFLEGQGTKPQRVGDATFSESVVWRNDERKLVWRAYVVDDSFFASKLRMKASVALLRLKGLPANVQTMAIATDIQSDSDNARDVLHKFLTNISPRSLLWRPARQGKTDVCVG